jgi:putative phosphoesterase
VRIAIFGDIHGNLIALETFLKFVEKRVDSYICTGDIVNYGPWSEECVSVIRELTNLICVKGNHEDLFTLPSKAGTNELVREFTDCSVQGFTQYEWIKNLPYNQDFHGFKISHTLQERYIYKDSDVEILSPTIIGHSHQQFIRLNLDKMLINPGSIGQNREFINAVQFMIMDTSTNTFESFTLIHDVDAVVLQMKARGYSAQCVDYYLNKPRL